MCRLDLWCMKNFFAAGLINGWCWCDVRSWGAVFDAAAVLGDNARNFAQTAVLDPTNINRSLFGLFRTPLTIARLSLFLAVSVPSMNPGLVWPMLPLQDSVRDPDLRFKGKERES